MSEVSVHRTVKVYLVPLRVKVKERSTIMGSGMIGRTW